MASTGPDTTIHHMHIVIPGALPPATVARELARELGRNCPSLMSLFERLSATMVPLHPAQTGCTPVEHEMLEQYAGLPDMGTRAVGSLAAMHAGVTQPGEIAWVAQMCTLSIGHEQVTLSLAEDQALSTEASSRLMDEVLAIAPPSGFRLTPIDSPWVNHAWRVQFDHPVHYESMSPRAVRALGVTDWWPQDPSTQAWRKWLNEVQMAWHSHPINQNRMDQGLDPINGLWLYGGGAGWPPRPPAPEVLTLTHLEQPHDQGDWSSWLRSLHHLNLDLEKHPTISRVTLLGDARKVVLANEKTSWWRRLTGTRKQTWSDWWTPPA